MDPDLRAIPGFLYTGLLPTPSNSSGSSEESPAPVSATNFGQCHYYSLKPYLGLSTLTPKQRYYLGYMTLPTGGDTTARFGIQIQKIRNFYKLILEHEDDKSKKADIHFFVRGKSLRFWGLIISENLRTQNVAKPALATLFKYAEREGFELSTTHQRKPLVNKMLMQFGFRPDNDEKKALIHTSHMNRDRVHVYYPRFRPQNKTIRSQKLALLDAPPPPHQTFETYVETAFTLPLQFENPILTSAIADTGASFHFVPAPAESSSDSASSEDAARTASGNGGTCVDWLLAFRDYA